jgi:ribosomal protein S18 acetylase RimI-like enzyme
MGGIRMSEELVLAEMTEIMADDLDSLSRLLVDVVADGASIGFLPPLSEQEARSYWSEVLAPDVRMWVARLQGEIVGSIQLHLAMKQNGSHRAEIAKLMVHTGARRRGIAQKLMALAEDKAHCEGRSLLVLDTREGDPSNSLYSSLGYIEAGRIPEYARSADGKLDTSVFYYKLLEQQEERASE